MSEIIKSNNIEWLEISQKILYWKLSYSDNEIGRSIRGLCCC